MSEGETERENNKSDKFLLKQTQDIENECILEKERDKRRERVTQIISYYNI